MANIFKKLLGEKDSPYEKKIYLAQPSILYHTRTEKECKSYLKGHFDAKKIYTPMDYRKRDRAFFKQLMVESDVVIGITIEDVYTYSVWQDLEYAESAGKPFFTLRVVKSPSGKDLDLFLIEGMADFEKLSWEDTKSLYMEIQKKQLGFPLLFGRRPEY